MARGVVLIFLAVFFFLSVAGDHDHDRYLRAFDQRKQQGFRRQEYQEPITLSSTRQKGPLPREEIGHSQTPLGEVTYHSILRYDTLLLKKHILAEDSLISPSGVYLRNHALSERALEEDSISHEKFSRRLDGEGEEVEDGTIVEDGTFAIVSHNDEDVFLDNDNERPDDEVVYLITKGKPQRLRSDVVFIPTSRTVFMSLFDDLQLRSVGQTRVSSQPADNEERSAAARASGSGGIGVVGFNVKELPKNVADSDPVPMGPKELDLRVPYISELTSDIVQLYCHNCFAGFSVHFDVKFDFSLFRGLKFASVRETRTMGFGYGFRADVNTTFPWHYYKEFALLEERRVFGTTFFISGIPVSVGLWVGVDATFNVDAEIQNFPEMFEIRRAYSKTVKTVSTLQYSHGKWSHDVKRTENENVLPLTINGMEDWDRDDMALVVSSNIKLKPYGRIWFFDFIPIYMEATPSFGFEVAYPSLIDSDDCSPKFAISYKTSKLKVGVALALEPLRLPIIHTKISFGGFLPWDFFNHTFVFDFDREGCLGFRFNNNDIARDALLPPSSSRGLRSAPNAVERDSDVVVFDLRETSDFVIQGDAEVLRIAVTGYEDLPEDFLGVYLFTSAGPAPTSMSQMLISFDLNGPAMVVDQHHTILERKKKSEKVN